MDCSLTHFKDILEPRRREFSHIPWVLRKLDTIVPYKQYVRVKPKKHKKYTLSSNKIQGIIDRICRENGLPKKEVEERVRKILDEIGFNKNLSTIRNLGYALTVICRYMTKGIHVNETKILALRSQMGSAPVIYVPSHRSYADFILMSYVLFYYNIEIPAIAAGMDFHEMWMMGTMLRDTGAFFMRRSYNDDPLYWDTFRQYVYELVTKGDNGIEFFIEGTRSRSNKSLVPKYGLLSMILKAYFNADVPDILFCPVNITYDRIMEEKLFAYELLGVPKPKESTSGFFKALSVVLEDFGNYYVNFGEPISAREFFKDRTGPSSEKVTLNYLRTVTEPEKQITSKLANEIVTSQQKLCVITTFNLVAITTSYHFLMGQKLTMDALVENVKYFGEILQRLGALVETHDVSFSINNIHKNLIYVDGEKNILLRSNAVVVDKENLTKLKGHGLSDKTMTLVVPYVMLQLYVNPVLHYLVNISIITTILMFHLGSNIRRDYLFEQFQFLRLLMSKEFVYTDVRDQQVFKECLEHMKSLEMLTLDGDLCSRGNNDKLLKMFAFLFEPFINNYFFVLTVLMELSEDICKEKTIFARTQEKIEEALHLDTIVLHPYALNLDSISNCLQSLISFGAIVKMRRENGFVYKSMRPLLASILLQIEPYCKTSGNTLLLPKEVFLKNKL